MYINIRLMNNDGSETGNEFNTPAMLKFIASAAYDRLVDMVKET